jgi:pyruvate/2-oxoglutarate dehydrogenase complex dihydrolipoamide dehydrogenase (E3) component
MRSERPARADDTVVPMDWDLIVIGGGSGGLTATQVARRLGARVLLVEKKALGGDCLFTGCIPSKTLIRAAKVAHLMRHADRHGLPARRRLSSTARR